MKFFSKLFGKNKQASEAEDVEIDLLNLFMERGKRWGLQLTPEMLANGLEECKQAAYQDDQVFKLPSQYGTKVLLMAEKGDEGSRQFAEKALQNGATPQDFTQWWDAHDLFRRMMEWELDMRRRQLFQEKLAEISRTATGVEELENVAGNMVIREMPAFGEPSEYFGGGNNDRYLPVELQIRVGKIMEQLTEADYTYISQNFSSFNAYLYQMLMPDIATSEEKEIERLHDEALSHFEAGRNKQAYDLAIRCLDLANQIYGREQISEAVLAMDFTPIFFANGAYHLAEDALRKQLERTDSLHQNYGMIQSSYGQVLVEMENFSKAVKLQEEAYHWQKKRLNDDRGHEFFARICNNYGLALSHSKEYAKAAKIYSEALEAAEKVFGAEHELYTLIISNLGIELIFLNQAEKALPLLLQVKQAREKILPANHPDIAEAIGNLSGTYHMLNDYPKAFELGQQALAMRANTIGKQHPDYATNLSNLILFGTQMGSWASILPLGFDLVETWKNYIMQVFPHLTEKEKVSFYHRVYIETNGLYQISFQPEGAAIQETVLDFKINTKGLALYASLDLSRKTSKTNNQILSDITRQISQIREELASLYVAQTQESISKQIQQLEKELHKQEKEYQALAIDSGLSYMNWVSWKEISQKLPSQSIALEIIKFFSLNADNQQQFTHYGLVFFTSDWEKPRFVEIPEGDALEAAFRERYADSVKTNFKGEDADEEDDFNFLPDEAESLYELLWGPIAPVVKGYKKLYLSADGIYHELNPETLFNPETNQFVIDEIEIQRLGSFKDLLLPQSEETQNKSAVLVGMPNYQMGVENQPNPQISPLPGTEQEVKQIAKSLQTQNWQVEALLAEQSTEEAVSAVKSPSLLHLSTHGFFYKNLEKPKLGKFLRLDRQQLAENPLFRSGLMLAGAERALSQAEIGAKEGLLTAYEVLNMDLTQTDLVVLSACETGLGHQHGDEGVFGLQRAFLLAGAQSLIMSLWKVDDWATQKLLTYFYDNWLKSGNKRQAFREAQLELRKEHPAPYYWGAFVLVGKG